MTDAQPSILLALLSRSRWSDVHGLLGGWDMINAACPSREQLEEPAGVLVGSGLAEWSEPWRVRLTGAGDGLRRTARSRGLGMRQLPAELDRILQTMPLERTAVPLPPALYQAALAAYRAPRRPTALQRLWAVFAGRSG